MPHSFIPRPQLMVKHDISQKSRTCCCLTSILPALARSRLWAASRTAGRGIITPYEAREKRPLHELPTEQIRTRRSGRGTIDPEGSLGVARIHIGRGRPVAPRTRARGSAARPRAAIQWPARTGPVRTDRGLIGKPRGLIGSRSNLRQMNPRRRKGPDLLSQARPVSIKSSGYGPALGRQPLATRSEEETQQGQSAQQQQGRRRLGSDGDAAINQARHEHALIVSIVGRAIQ